MDYIIGKSQTGGVRWFYFIKRIFISTIATCVCLVGCLAVPAGQNTPPVAAVPTLPASIPLTGSNAACTSPAPLTAAVTQGPYFKAGSPEKSSLIDPGMPGMKLILSGFVFTTDCKPISNAQLDFWQANANGQYDNSGYTLRGHQFTDASGHYQLTTIVPGLYTGRTEHIHVRVQAPSGPVLTTQLFFPGVPQNQEDRIFNSSLLMTVQNGTAGETAEFNFVVNPKK
jgi:protocatechuate 3,4-dioxygenase beta subunit